LPAILLYNGRGNQIRKGVGMNQKIFNKPDKKIGWADYMLGSCFLAIASVCIWVCVIAYL